MLMRLTLFWKTIQDGTVVNHSGTMLKSDDRRRILFVSDEASFTGAPIFIYKLLKHLKTDHPDFDIVFHCTKNGPLVQMLQNEGFPVIVIQKRSSEGHLSKACRRFIYYLRFMALLNQLKPDLVYSNTMVNFSQVVLGRLMGYRVLVHVHEGRNFISRAKFKFRLSSFFTTKFIAGSEYVAGVLKDYTGRHGIVIHNGINMPDSPQFPPYESFRHAEGKGLALCIIGTVDRNKAQLVAIKAVEHLIQTRHLNIQLKIVGRVVDSEYGNEVRSYIRNHHLHDTVTFIESVEDIEEVYSAIDALLVCSYDEVFPTVILEAMAFQRPVIASDAGGIPEMIQNGTTGFLFEKGNFIDLADKIMLLFDDERRREIISNALTKVKTSFSLMETNRKIAETINCILASDSGNSKLQK